MTSFRRREFALWLALAFSSSQARAGTAPPELRNRLPDAILAGQAKFTFWGFDVYQAALWVEPGFAPAAFERHAFALELLYLRDFSNEQITKRSLDEMRRQGGVAPATLAAWQPLLQGAFPDIVKGDRIIGLHLPGSGAVFLTNTRQSGAVADETFARRFFAIWLSPQTSEPQLRSALLARLPAR